MKQAETTINLIEILADFMDALDPEKFYFRLWQWLQFVRARIKISLGIIRDETKPLGISAALVDLFSGQLANMFFNCAKTQHVARHLPEHETRL